MVGRESEVRSISAGNGRVLEVVPAGPPGGIALFSRHGTPGAAQMFDPLVDIGAERESSPHHMLPAGLRRLRAAEGALASCATDVVACGRGGTRLDDGYGRGERGGVGCDSGERPRAAGLPRAQAESMLGTSSEQLVMALGDVVCDVDRSYGDILDGWLGLASGRQ